MMEHQCKDIVTERSIHSYSNQFEWTEYIIFSGVLLSSAAIGVFFRCTGSRQEYIEEYLLADRKMSSIPIALSLLCSFVSSVTLLGNPVEIYYYGLQYSVVIASFILLTLSLAYFYVPVFFRLQLSSAFEYFELRFSKTVRTVVSSLGIIHYLIYMAIVVYGPSLALSQVTGINSRLSSSSIFLVCIFYSSLGGLKAVLWTGALQCVIILCCLCVVVGKGISDIGGSSLVWEKAVNSSRIEFLNFDPDPRVRHTFWTALIGGYFMWMPIYAVTQSQIQRYLSIPTLSGIRRALLMNMIGLIFIISLFCMIGLVISAKYQNCDPVRFAEISNSDQILPIFVMTVLGYYPGFPCLFVATITCASLSSVSSGLNGVAAILTFDYIKPRLPNLSNKNLTRISKIVCAVFGMISFGFAFVAEQMENSLPVASNIVGIMLGPALGIFTLGMFFPWANSKGSLLGMTVSCITLLCMVIGRNIATFQNLLSDQKLEMSSLGCYNITTYVSNNVYSSNGNNDMHWKTQDYGLLMNILSISYIWYPGLGAILTITFGLVFSLLLMKFENYPGVNPEHISPPVLWLLTKCFPSHMSNWIQPDEYPILLTMSPYSLSLKRSDFHKETVCDVTLKRLSPEMEM